MVDGLAGAIVLRLRPYFLVTEHLRDRRDWHAAWKLQVRESRGPVLEPDAMKCQRCDKPATFHITELTGGKPQELHLCEDHARQYLTQAGNEPAAASSMAAALAQQMAQQMAVGQTAEELAELDQQTCPVCGITFYEFRSKGRLGCPHDYVCFEKQLEPLILNVHGEGEHKGKVPKHSSDGSQKRTELIRYRREMQEAIEEENYERASELRDTIRKIEESDDT